MEKRNTVILICTDAAPPQVNGVVNTYTNMWRQNTDGKYKLKFITPKNFLTVYNPFYPEIRLAIPLRIGKKISRIKPDYIHIATEGPIGWAARAHCIKNKIPFTTSYHTKFPEFLKESLGIPLCITNYFVRKFHAPSRCVMVATNSLKEELEAKGFKNMKIWSRGVDTELFKGDEVPITYHNIAIYVGRVSAEKNLDAFLNADLEFTRKYIIGDGPMLQEYRRKYLFNTYIHFFGKLPQDEIAKIMKKAKVFVFPSKSDTFGLVIIEALCTGLPVVAFDVTGPRDILKDDEKLGILVKEDCDFGPAILQCMSLKKENFDHIKSVGMKYTWENSYKQFVENVIG